jgi:L-amino acid N-acyltransferase YncA
VSDIAVRPIRAEDVPQACAILNRIIEIGGTTAFEQPVSEDEFDAWYVNGADLICCHVALDAAGAVAGFQWLGRNDSLPEGCGDIASFTRREPVLRGAGRALFACTVAVARDRGLAEINATIRADNALGLAYYGKMGFRDHVVTPAVPLRDGRPVDRISKRFDLRG